MCVHMSVCAGGGQGACLSAFVYVYVKVGVCDVCVWVCVCVYVCMYVCVCMSVCVCMYMCAYVCESVYVSI